MERLNDIVCKFASSFYNQQGHIVFDPPVYVQRYNAAINCLNHAFFKKKIHHIIEYGCAEMKFFTFIKSALMDRNLWIKLIDIDEELLMRSMNNIQPLIMDHVKKREHNLNVELWQGDVSIYNQNFRNVDAVVALELIEHLYPNTLEQVPYQIFENINPKIVIITTPNCEYNIVFDLEPGSFRHDDHKFEWTREQFKDWCENICERYPQYLVQIEGIGNPPTGHDVKEIGHTSQLALFIRKDFIAELQEQTNDETNDDLQLNLASNSDISCDGYRLLKSIEYPVFKDTRGKVEKINDEVCYHVNRLKFMGDQYYNYDNDRTEIPVHLIASACWEITTNENEIIDVIHEKYQVENNMIIMDNSYESQSDDQLDDDREGFKQTVK